MAFLLNPNFVYILIVAAFLLTVIAVLIPGTGFLEVAAVVVWAGGFWLSSRLHLHVWAAVVLGLGFIPLFFALKRKYVVILLTLSMIFFLIGSAYLFKGDAWWKPGVSPLLALVVSAIAGGLVWLVFDKLIETMEAPPIQDLSVLIGAVGEARTEVHHEGSVYVRGENWSARSDHLIKPGTRVEVLSREGLVLTVKAVKG